MSIAVLNQVYDETRRLAIAGSNLASGDFRLKKLVPPLEKSAEKAPVFGQVAKSIETLIDAPQKESAQALLDLGSLVSAILYTQGQTAIEGTLKEIESSELGNQTTQVSAKLMKPLIEALTTTGSGRLEIVSESFERGAFQDLRMINYAVRALDDVYPELADFIADKVIPQYGNAVVPLIKDQINIKGRGANVRRLRILHHKNPEIARPIVLDAFENGSKEMKIAALGCLGGSQEDLPHLHEQANARSKEVRRVAFEQLSNFIDDETIAIFTKALNSKDAELVVAPISKNKSPELLKLVHESIESQSEELLTGKTKTKLGPQLQRFSTLLTALYGRSDKTTLKLIEALFAQRVELLKLKGTPVSGNDVIEHLTNIMLHSNSSKLQKLLVDARDEFNGGSFANCFSAATITHKPAEVYSLFSPYYLVQGKGKGKIKERKEVVHNVICYGIDCGNYYAYQYHNQFPNATRNFRESDKKIKWDPQWLMAAIQQDDIECITELAIKKDKTLHNYLDNKFKQQLKKTSRQNMVAHILGIMVRTEHTKVTDCWITAVQKISKKSQSYEIYWLAPLIAYLPVSAGPKIEKVLPDLPENTVDQILEYLVVLKSKKK